MPQGLALVSMPADELFMMAGARLGGRWLLGGWLTAGWSLAGC